jgi:hypothetical protein
MEQRVRDLEREVRELKQLLRERKEAAPATQEEMDKISEIAEALKPGLENFLLSGYATADFQAPEDSSSTFGVGFNPVFLWQMGEDVFFEGELEIAATGSGETEFALEYAQIVYFLHDYITVGAGKFLLPFGIFPERLHPTWINKFPTNPIPYQHHGGIAPFTDVGAQVRGGIPLFGEAKMNYGIYVGNGPRLITSGHHAGELRFDNHEDINGNKAAGGRIGFLPIPELEVGFSYMRAGVDPDGFTFDVDANLFAADLSYVREAELISGQVDLRFEWIRQDIDNVPAFAFDNKKTGWYTQIAYRPSLLEVDVLPNLELVFRYTDVDWPDGTPWGGGVDKRQYAIGANYWITPSAVVKVGYEINDNLEGTAEGEDLFVIQFAYGF